MTDQYYDDDDTDTDDKPPRSDSDWAELRRAKKARDKAEKELQALKAERAFEKAGLNLDDPKASYFIKAYDGEVTPEAIKAEAVKAGFITEPSDDPNPPDLQAQADVTAASLGAPAEGGAFVDTGALDEAFRTGGTEGMMAYLRQSGIPVNEVQ